jgi:hypothetical protein
MSNGPPPGCPDTSVPLDNAGFRTMWAPAFDDTTKYPDATVTWWLCQAQNVIDPCAWGQMYQKGQGSWVAHELAMLASAAAQAAGGNPTGIGGIVSSKSVGPVSVSYDTQIGTEKDAGYYNYTIYGRQYIHWARLLGMGPIQVGAVTIPPFGTARSWLGPIPLPGVFG